MKEILLQLQSDIDFNMILCTISMSSMQKLNIKMLKLNNVINQMNLTNIYRTFTQTLKSIPPLLHLMEFYVNIIIYLDTKQISEDIQ